MLFYAPLTHERKIVENVAMNFRSRRAKESLERQGYINPLSFTYSELTLLVSIEWHFDLHSKLLMSASNLFGPGGF